jgi:hypothetical protein
MPISLGRFEGFGKPRPPSQHVAVNWHKVTALHINRKV